WPGLGGALAICGNRSCLLLARSTYPDGSPANIPATPTTRQNQRSGWCALNIATVPIIQATPRMKRKSAANLYALEVIVWNACRTQKVSDGSQPPMTFESSLSETAGSCPLHRVIMLRGHSAASGDVARQKSPR